MTFCLIDSHCHIDLEPLKSVFSELLLEATSVGITGFVVPGVHPDGWSGIYEMADEEPAIKPAYGIHPMHSECLNDQIMEGLLKFAVKGVAIGEIGLDPSYKAPMELQENVFRKQLRIAVALDLPVLIHCRRAFQRILKIMREERIAHVGGIMHAFSGSVEMAHEFAKLGFAISISGSVTWDNAVKPISIARKLPLEQLVLETDSPDMTPQRYRGSINRPAWIMETARTLAAVRKISIEEVAEVTSANVTRILRLGRSSA